jgi:hypothetical protein
MAAPSRLGHVTHPCRKDTISAHAETSAVTPGRSALKWVSLFDQSGCRLAGEGLAVKLEPTKATRPIRARPIGDSATGAAGKSAAVCPAARQQSNAQKDGALRRLKHLLSVSGLEPQPLAEEVPALWAGKALTKSTIVLIITEFKTWHC